MLTIATAATNVELEANGYVLRLIHVRNCTCFEETLSLEVDQRFMAAKLLVDGLQ